MASEEPIFTPARLHLIGLTILISIAAVCFFAGKPFSDGRTAALLSGVNLSLLIGATALRRDRVLLRLLLFGGAFGAVELIADWLCIRFTHTLDYTPARSALLFASPWWMPLAWMVVAAQIGFFGALAVFRWGLVRGATAAALLGAINIPFYEEMAFHCHWWRYLNCVLWGHTPPYLIVAEGIIGLALAPLAGRALHARTVLLATGWGALAGISTIVGGIVGYGWVERILARW